METRPHRLPQPLIPKNMSQINTSSNCCDALPLGEVIAGWGICLACREHAFFPEPCDKCNGQGWFKDGDPTLDPCPSCQGTGSKNTESEKIPPRPFILLDGSILHLKKIGWYSNWRLKCKFDDGGGWTVKNTLIGTIYCFLRWNLYTRWLLKTKP